MKACGIVVEYNPLHYGHIYHLNKAKELSGCDCLVAVMSGNFVQRGDFAIIDKWRRAKAAVEAGVDLVIELPFPFATQAATQFASNAISILHNAKCDTVVFGSETNNIEELREIAEMSFNVDNFKENMSKGYSYPKSYGYMSDSYGPNDILAISYLKALASYPEMKAISIMRQGNYHDDDTNVAYPSALAIRKAISNNENIDKLTPMFTELENNEYPTWNNMYSYVRLILLTTPPEELSKIFLMDEGIENHLIKQAATYDNYADFLNNCVTRRYTKSRIQRTLCQLIVHNTKQDMKDLGEYNNLRVLAFSEKGKQYLKELKEQGVKIANHFTANPKTYRDLEYKAAIAYGTSLSAEKRKEILRLEIEGLHKKNDTA